MILLLAIPSDEDAAWEMRMFAPEERLSSIVHKQLLHQEKQLLCTAEPQSIAQFSKGDLLELVPKYCSVGGWSYFSLTENVSNFSLYLGGAGPESACMRQTYR